MARSGNAGARYAGGSVMRLRAAVEFTDGVGDAEQVWPDAYVDQDVARRWQNAVVACHPAVSTAMELELECDVHGWQARSECVDCHDPLCWDCGKAASDNWDEPLCEGCQELRAEDAEEDSGCLCGGPPETGPCFCPSCRR